MTRTVVFAGGGTGGHIFPSLAVLERLRERDVPFEPHFFVSNRPLDEQILTKEHVGFTASPVRPLTVKPHQLAGFLGAWRKGVNQARQELQSRDVGAVVSMGGFVSGPAVVAAEEIGVPVALVNLDAVPGKANRKLARKASQVFSAYRTQSLRAATPIGLPLRRAAVGDKGKAEARLALGIDANRPTLVVIGGSQGAQSMNRMMIKLSHKARFVEAMRGWQILHVCGPGNEEEMLQGYEGCDINVSVMGFCDRVGLAWSAATIAISRAGAGSVAEAWSNATPTIFLPYPYHRDQHQRLNAMPLCNIGGALLMEDQIDPALNSREIIGVLRGLTENPGRCEAMVKTMHSSHPADGADAIAQWVADRLMSPAVAEPVRQVA